MCFAQGVAESAASAVQQDMPLAPVNGADPDFYRGLAFCVITLAAAPFVFWLAAKIAGPRKATEPAGWGLPQVGAVAALAILLQAVPLLFVSLTRSPAANADGVRELDVVAALVTSTVLSFLTAVFAFSSARATSPTPAGALGLVPASVVRTLGVALVLYVLAIGVQAGLTQVWGACLREFGVTDTQQPLARLLVDVPHGERALVVFLGVALVPFLEEFLFRGFLQPAFERHLAPFVAILLTSLVFGALHGLAAFVPIVGLSLVLGHARRLTGNLWAPWVVHALNNGAAFALLWGVSPPGG